MSIEYVSASAEAIEIDSNLINTDVLQLAEILILGT